eukprot:Gregarina_sp_Poly_1__10126@NODE_690_length_6749_cov_8_016761_g520_i0_p6_GENE_NODE_690_length_6749_cov_8_016761_g520_i0NODE_690_length_6749_cov_8_016761_g520_i0_p6_ORF_typecomplete_len133_score6_35_NODE_690_length_6749_cov_8_016761_g520_i048175215
MKNLILLLLLALTCSHVAQSTYAQSTSTQGSLIGYADYSTCSAFNDKCGRCIKQSPCSYCASSATCQENALNAVCDSEWIHSKWKCPGHLRWWGVLLILLSGVCLLPVLGVCCFLFVIKKLCCPSEHEADDY